MTQFVQEKVEKIEKPITAWILLGCIFLLVCTYAYFINGAIVNAVKAKDMRVEISALTSSVSSLEAAYLDAKSLIDLDYALQLGFAESKSDTIYIAKRGQVSLSFNQ